MLLISAYTGIGSGRSLAIFINARPPAREPVKPTARMRGCATSAAPSARELPLSSEKTPSGRAALPRRGHDRLRDQIAGARMR